MVIFGAHTSNSLARSLARSLPRSVPLSSSLPPSLTSPQLNSTQRNTTHHTSAAHLIVHAFHHSPTYLLVHSFLRSKIRSLTQLFTLSRNDPIIHSFPHSFKYSRIIQLFIHSPNTIKANIFFIHCYYVYYRWRLIDKYLAAVLPPHHCLLWGEPPVSD